MNPINSTTPETNKPSPQDGGNKPGALSAALGSALTLEQLGKLSEDLDSYMDWAQIWHKQAGGYTASDTALVMMRIERWARYLTDLTGKPKTPMRKIEDAQDAFPKTPNAMELSDAPTSTEK